MAPRGPRTNSNHDKDWIDEHAMELRLNREAGLLQWSGKSADLGSSYQMQQEYTREELEASPELFERDARRCRRTIQILDDNGRPILDADSMELRRRCPNWSVRGAGLCVEHLKGSAAVIEKAKLRLIGAADAAVGMLVDLALDDTVSPSDRIKALNSVLDRAGVKGGVEVEVGVTPEWKNLLGRLGSQVGADEDDA